MNKIGARQVIHKLMNFEASTGKMESFIKEWKNAFHKTLLLPFGTEGSSILFQFRKLFN